LNTPIGRLHVAIVAATIQMSTNHSAVFRARHYVINDGTRVYIPYRPYGVRTTKMAKNSNCLD